jgi:Uma2 family endonuclease
MLRKFEPVLENDYPTSDGRPMAETDLHRKLMVELIEVLEFRYEADPNSYVSGNMLIFYKRDDRRRHVSPDVFVVKGVPKQIRPNYLIWEEKKGPDIVIEVTSKTTRNNDTGRKFDLYRDKLKVKEYFLFDPTEDYLSPSLQGYRLHAGQYRPILDLAHRLPSKVLGLHLERAGTQLRLWDPATNSWVPTQSERRAEAEYQKNKAEEKALQTQEKALQAVEKTLQAQEKALQAQEKAEVERAGRERAEQATREAQHEIERLRQELEALRRSGS